MDSESRALLLDLDGTIADTLPHLFACFRHAVAPWVVRPPTDAEVEATFGPAERGCLALLVPPEHLDLAEERFHDAYESGLARSVSVVDGVADVIDHARWLGWRVGVFTAKCRRSAEFTLSELGLRDRVETLVSSDDVAQPKPDPDGVHRASIQFNVPVPRILLVGDSPLDVQAGRAAGSLTAAALWAAFRPERLRQAGADFVCETVADLHAAVDALNSSG
jgi:HAD superfamily hydrolase (TIGR01509 family)